MRQKKLVNKQIAKHAAFCCKICGETNYHLLDVHRINYGENGGKYTQHNIVVLCPTDHRKVHAGLIKILGWVDSSIGPMLHYIDEKGNEQFK
jgi:hypothetical protein